MHVKSPILTTPILAGMALLALAGCAQSAQQIAWSNRAHTQIAPHEVTAELKIDTFVTGERLGGPERDAVKYFAAAYREEGHGAVVISRPSNGPDDVSAMRAAADARAVLLTEGIDMRSIVEGPYDATGARSAPLVISYRTWEAAVRGCPDIAQVDLAATGSNSASPALGCAVAHNMAAQIANPSDLVKFARVDPADIGRRTIVLTKYRNGEPTGAERPDAASGRVSEAVD